MNWKLAVGVAILILMTGCSKEQFQPKEVQSVELPEKGSPFFYDYTQKGESFRESGLFFEDSYYDPAGRKLGEFKYIGYDLAAAGDRLKDLRTGRVYKLPGRVLTATRHGELVAFVTENNGYGLLNLKTGQLPFYSADDQQFAGTYMPAFPIFYQDIVAFPLLNGIVVFYSLPQQQVVNRFVITTSTSPFNNNIIYLNILDDQLYAATPNKIVVFGSNYYFQYRDDIKHVIDDGKNIYIFTTDGRIIKFGPGLRRLKEVKLKFAQLYAPTICHGYIYTVEKGGGYLIKIDPKTLHYWVLDGPAFDTSDPLRLAGCKIYNDTRIFELK
jgi:hypothetical protein